MNKIITISDDISDDKNENHKYLRKNIIFDKPENAFQPEINVTQLDEYLKQNINFGVFLNDKPNLKPYRTKMMMFDENGEPDYDVNPEPTVAQLELLENYNKLMEENSLLKSKLEQLEQKLKKYTNGDNHKRYYEKNKDKIKKEGLAYLKNLKLENPAKIKEYNHNAYLKRKEKKNLLKNAALNDPVVVVAAAE